MALMSSAMVISFPAESMAPSMSLPFFQLVVDLVHSAYRDKKSVLAYHLETL